MAIDVRKKWPFWIYWLQLQKFFLIIGAISFAYNSNFGNIFDKLTFFLSQWMITHSLSKAEGKW